MKNIFKLLVLLGIAIQANAQSKITQGKAELAISYPELSEEMKQMEAMLPHEMTVYFKAEKSRTELPGTMMGSAITISDAKANELIVLMDVMGKKMAIRQTDADRKKMEAEQVKNGTMPKVKITKVSGTKTIAGYECKKAIIEVTDGGEVHKSECYYTDLLPKMKDQNDVYFKDLDGFMMEYTITQSGVAMKVVATAVTQQKVEDKMFVIAPGYKLVTEDELEKIMSSGGY